MLGPEDLHHKEFESNYKQFFKVYEGIDRNARFLQTAGQESFKLQKVQYVPDFTENKMLEKEEQTEKDHMNTMNDRTKKLQFRNRSQETIEMKNFHLRNKEKTLRELIVEKQKNADQNKDVNNKQALLLIKREHDLRFLKTMSKAQTEFMRKHKETSEIISKVIENKVNLKDVKDDILRCIQKAKIPQVSCQCPEMKKREDDRSKPDYHKNLEKFKPQKSRNLFASKNLTHREMIAKTNELLKSKKFADINNPEDKLNFIKSLQSENDIQKVLSMLSLNKAKSKIISPRMEQPKICIINEDVKQLEASHANLSQRSGIKYTSRKSVLSDSKGFNQNKRFGFKSPQVKSTSQRLEINS